MAAKKAKPKTLTLWLATDPASTDPDQCQWSVSLCKPFIQIDRLGTEYWRNRADNAYLLCDRGRRIVEVLTGFAFPPPGKCRKVTVETRRPK